MSNNDTRDILRRRRGKIEEDSANWKKQYRYIDYLVQLAARNPSEGILQEPRAYWDVMPALISTTQSVFNNPAPFMNGEKYPVTLTHMTAALFPDFESSPELGTTEEDIQRIGLRLVWDGTYYQSDRFIALPNWHNCVSTNSVPLSRSSSHYTFDRPLILTSRDSLAVRVKLNVTPAVDSTRRFEVAFEGTGLLSQRPYAFSAFVDLANETTTTLDAERFINGASEPIALTDMTVLIGAESTDAVGQGDIRVGSIDIRVIGNGTQAAWFQGPDNPTITTIMPSVLLGVNAGRCIVHHFPGPGLRMEPGDLFQVEALALDDTAVGLNLAIAFHGYLAVT